MNRSNLVLVLIASIFIFEGAQAQSLDRLPSTTTEEKSGEHFAQHVGNDAWLKRYIRQAAAAASSSMENPATGKLETLLPMLDAEYRLDKWNESAATSLDGGRGRYGRGVTIEFPSNTSEFEKHLAYASLLVRFDENSDVFGVSRSQAEGADLNMKIRYFRSEKRREDLKTLIQSAFTAEELEEGMAESLIDEMGLSDTGLSGETSARQVRFSHTSPHAEIVYSPVALTTGDKKLTWTYQFNGRNFSYDLPYAHAEDAALIQELYAKDGMSGVESFLPGIGPDPKTGANTPFTGITFKEAPVDSAIGENGILVVTGNNYTSYGFQHPQAFVTAPTAAELPANAVVGAGRVYVSDPEDMYQAYLMADPKYAAKLQAAADKLSAEEEALIRRRRDRALQEEMKKFESSRENALEAILKSEEIGFGTTDSIIQQILGNDDFCETLDT